MTQANLYLLAVAQTRAIAMQDPLKQTAMMRDAAGLPPLVTALDVLARLGDAESATDVVRDLVLNAESWHDRDLDEAVHRFARARATADLREALTNGARTMVPALTHGERFEMAKQPVAKLLKKLSSLVASMPAGSAVMDPTANIDAGTTSELAEVRRILKRLGHIVGWLPRGAGNRGVAADLLALVDVPSVEPSRIRESDGVELNPSPQREIIRTLAEKHTKDSDVALIDVLRGEYPGVTARLAASRTEQAERDERVGLAQRTEWVIR